MVCVLEDLDHDVNPGRPLFPLSLRLRGFLDVQLPGRSSAPGGDEESDHAGIVDCGLTMWDGRLCPSCRV